MTKILIAVPTFENIHPMTFKSIYDLKNPTGCNLYFEYIRGYDCARARNIIAKKAISGEYDYLLSIDSDIIVPEDALLNYMQIPSDIVLGYYPRKDDRNMCEVYKLGDGFKKENRFSKAELKDSQSPRIECNGGGFGCGFVRVNVLKTLRYPYFQYVNYPDGNLLSEDLYFCSMARHANNYKIYVDTRIRCKHIKQVIFDC